MKYIAFISLLSLIFATSCNNKETSEKPMNIIAPKADKIAKNLEMHDDVRVDNYYWLNDRNNEAYISRI